MNLKYYLRGLGLGIIITAVIMGFVVGGKKTSMTDAEIKQKATELGMVDGNSRLVDSDESAEALLEELNSKDNEASAENSSDSNNTVVNDSDSTEAEDENSIDEEASEEKLTEDVDDDLLVDDSSNKNDSEDVMENAQAFLDDDPDKKENSQLEDTTKDYPTEEQPSKPIEDTKKTDNASSEATENTGKTISLVISSGDSSYTVAKKLEAQGLVPNASDYDTFLCKYGYDRYIRTGTFQISSDASNEEIAKMITGK